MEKEYMERELSYNEIDNLSIEKMKEILQAVNNISKDEIESKKKLNLQLNAGMILSMCGKAGLKE